jgi:hypothetical protein
MPASSPRELAHDPTPQLNECGIEIAMGDYLT